MSRVTLKKRLWAVYRNLEGGVRRLVTRLWHMVGHFWSPFSWWATLFLKRPVPALLILLGVCILGVAAFGLSLRLLQPEKALVFSPFDVKSDGSSPIQLTESQIANRVADEVEQILVEAHRFVGHPWVNSRDSMLALARPITTTKVEIEIRGFSRDRLRYEWLRLRQEQVLISGDLLLTQRALHLRARIEGQGVWEVGPLEPSGGGLTEACRQLAIRMLSDLRPDIVILFQMQNGRTADALGVARRWTEREPNKPHPHFFLGQVLYHAGRYSESLGSYERAVSLDPNQPIFYVNLGVTLYTLGDFERSIAASRQALHLDPTFQKAYLNLGSALAKTGRHDQAVDCYRKGLKLNPNFFELLVNMGESQAQLGQFDLAEEAQRKAAEIRPLDPVPHYNLGNLYLRQGRLQQAEARYRKSLELEGNFYAAHINLAEVLRLQGRIGDAEAELRKAITSGPEFCEAHYNLAWLLQDQQRHEDAKREWKKAQKLAEQMSRSSCGPSPALSQ